MIIVYGLQKAGRFVVYGLPAAGRFVVSCAKKVQNRETTNRIVQAIE